jgi:hypothetical protein
LNNALTYYLNYLFCSGISRCEQDDEDSCKCEKYFEGISGQNCSEGRHNCDDSKTCYMNHQWHACCLNEEAGAEADVQLQDEVEDRQTLRFPYFSFFLL